MPNPNAESVKHFYLTEYWSGLLQLSSIFTWHNTYQQRVKCFYLTKYPIIKLAKMQYIQVIAIFINIHNMWGAILHYKTFVRLWNQGYVFHSHVTSKITLKIPLHHKLYQITAQFTQNPQINFDTRFDKTLIFPSKTKLSDNLKI